MRRFLLLLLLSSFLAWDASAQDTAKVVAACGTVPSPVPPNGTGYPVGGLFPITQSTGGQLCVNATVTASISVNAQSSLQSLSAGAGNSFYEELSGGLYVHPVFGPLTAAGATTVDLTHGLPVNIVAGGGAGGTSSTDEAAFTAGTTALTIGGGFFQTTATNNALTNGQSGAFQLTANRAIFSNLRNSSGTEVGTAGAPLQVSVANTGANGTAIAVGATQTTSPWVDNITQIGGSSLALGQTTMANSIPVVLASNESFLGVNITEFGGTTVSIGQAAMAASMPVVIASNQSNLSVIGTATPSDTFGNPTTAVTSLSLMAGWDATNTEWRRVTVDAATGRPTVDVLAWAGSVLGAVSNYGTSPGAVAVPSANAFVTNTVTVLGGNTPGDGVANTAIAVPVEDFNLGWDATNTVWRRLQVDAATGTLKVDPGTVTIASNSSVNLAQVGGSAVALGQTTMSASIPVAIASNQSDVPINEAEIGGSAYALGSTTSASSAPAVIASDQAIVPGLASPGCAGQTVANTILKPFSNAGSGNNLLVVTGTAAKKIYICAVHFDGVAGAVNFALVEGTTTTNPCDTGAAGLLGGATAATGEIFTTNEGMTYGNGIGIVAKEATAADNVCVLFSTGVQVSGVITYAVF